MPTDPIWKSLYAHDGPFATVYLDASRNTESGAHEVELRWRALRDRLTAQGADSSSLAALEDEVMADRGPGRHGLVLVAADGEVAFAATLPQPPLTEEAVLAPLPHLMPYFAQRGPRVVHILAVVDRTGADLHVSDGEHATTATVTGSEQHPLHRTGRDDWSERHFQNRVEAAWETNARDVATAVGDQTVANAAQVVLVAGDPRARALLLDELRKTLRPGVEIVDVAEGGRAAGSSEEALQAAVHEALLHHTWKRRREVLEHLQQNLGRGEYAVQGVGEVVDAIRRAAVDTVVLSDDPSSPLTAWFGPDVSQFGVTREEVEALGVSDPVEDRLDSVLIRAVAGTGAQLHITPNAHNYVAGGIGALLRY